LRAASSWKRRLLESGVFFLCVLRGAFLYVLACSLCFSVFFAFQRIHCVSVFVACSAFVAVLALLCTFAVETLLWSIAGCCALCFTVYPALLYHCESRVTSVTVTVSPALRIF